MILFNQHKIYFFNVKFIDKQHLTYELWKQNSSTWNFPDSGSSSKTKSKM